MTGRRRRALIAAHDGSPRGLEVVARGRRIADAAGARLVIVHVTSKQMPYTSQDPEYQHILREELAHIFEPAKAVGGPDAETRAIGARSVIDGLLGAIDDEHAGVIVVGSSHHGRLGHVFYGDVARELAKRSNCYVDVVPIGEHEVAEAA